MDDIGSRIRTHREARGWSLRHLAGRLNVYGLRVTHSWVHKKERGVSKVTILELLQFAAVLGVSPIRLLGDDDTEIVITDTHTVTTSVTHRELRLWFAGAIESPFWVW